MIESESDAMPNLRSRNFLPIYILVIPIIILAVTFALLGVINRPGHSPVPVQEAQKPKAAPQSLFSGTKLDLEDFSLTEYTQDNGSVRKSFTISGKKLQTVNPKLGIFRIAIGKAIELKEPQITFYKNEQPIAGINSKTGSMNPLNKSINFFGDVNLITQDKKALTCEQLKWDNQGNYLLAEGNCVLISEQAQAVWADQLKTDVELKEYQIVNKDKNQFKNFANRFFRGGGKR